MERLTHPRSSGIKTGYWSPSKKDELIERLAAYEDTDLTPQEIYSLKAGTIFKALRTEWIPVEERLPEVANDIDDDDCPEFNVMIDGAKVPTTLYCSSDGDWFDDLGEVYTVVAWQPLPEPYQKEERE